MSAAPISRPMMRPPSSPRALSMMTRTRDLARIFCGFEPACTGPHHVDDQKRVFPRGPCSSPGSHPPPPCSESNRNLPLEKFGDESQSSTSVINDETSRWGTIVGWGRRLLHEFSRAVLPGDLHTAAQPHSRKEVAFGPVKNCKRTGWCLTAVRALMVS